MKIVKHRKMHKQTHSAQPQTAEKRAHGESPAYKPARTCSRLSIYRLTAVITVTALILAAALLLTGCPRYYKGEVAGYVRDSETDNGVNGATIHMYLEQPETAEDPSFIIETATMTSGGNAGYYSSSIIWEKYFAKFGSEGDSGAIWIGVLHEDYLSKVAKVSGILSDTMNVVPDIKIETSLFTVPSLTGRVVNESGEYLNGIRLVLDLESTPDEEEDYVATTQTIDDKAGSYQFTNIEWKDNDPDDAENSQDTEPAVIRVSDDEYLDADDTPLSVTLNSDQEMEAPQDIEVTIEQQTNFTCPEVTGRVVNSSGEGVNGVRVTLDIARTSDDEEFVATTATIDGIPGTYQFTDIGWRDETADTKTTDTETGNIEVDDDNYTGGSAESVTLYSDQTVDVPNDISVTRAPRTDFSANIRGECYYLDSSASDPERPIAGVDVTVTYTEDDETTNHTLTAQTNTNGVYTFLIQWTDSDSSSGTVNIPEGEDTISVDITYSSNDEPGNSYSFDNVTGYEVRSWINPNNIPDKVDTDPNA